MRLQPHRLEDAREEVGEAGGVREEEAADSKGDHRRAKCAELLLRQIVLVFVLLQPDDGVGGLALEKAGHEQGAANDERIDAGICKT